MLATTPRFLFKPLVAITIIIANVGRSQATDLPGVDFKRMSLSVESAEPMANPMPRDSAVVGDFNRGILA